MQNNKPQPFVAIVTGASSGIGREVVIELIKQGYQVHAAARRLAAMKDLEALGAQLHPLDLKKPDDITSFVKAVVAKNSRIDILVNNAGYGSYGAVEEVPMSEARAQIEVNLFAAAHLIQEVLPTMRRQRYGKIINVSSIGGKIWSPLGAWYHASKFALEGLSDSLRNEIRPFGIDVILIEPGAVKTEWMLIALESLKKNSSHGPYREMAQILTRLSQSPLAEKIATEPKQIAQLIIHAIQAKRPKARYVAPFSGRFMLWLRRVLSDRAFDWAFNQVFKLPKKL